jgi:sulfur relay (sulfurtransferase) complex TusBCD TusD component (DsrE family)
MANYLLIESRDPFESRGVAQSFELAASLARDGNQVTLFLVQNGVLSARKSPASEALAKVAQAGVEVLADEFSLRERGITAPFVKAAPLDIVIDHLADGRKVIWH